MSLTTQIVDRVNRSKNGVTVNLIVDDMMSSTANIKVKVTRSGVRRIIRQAKYDGLIEIHKGVAYRACRF